MDEFNQLYMTYNKQIYKYLFYLSGNNSIAEELTQETFLQAFKSISSFKGNSKVSTWLFQIAKYTFYSYLKKNKIVTRVTDTSTMENEIINLNTPETIYEQKEEWVDVVKAIRKLKQPHQEIIILRLYNELSFKDIGDIFKQSDTWARVTFYRAKTKLSSIIDGGEKT